MKINEQEEIMAVHRTDSTKNTHKVQVRLKKLKKQNHTH